MGKGKRVLAELCRFILIRLLNHTLIITWLKWYIHNDLVIFRNTARLYYTTVRYNIQPFLFHLQDYVWSDQDVNVFPRKQDMSK